MDDDETAMYDVRSSRDVVPLPGTLREDGRGQAETHREISAVIGATADPDSELDAAANSALPPPLILAAPVPASAHIFEGSARISSGPCHTPRSP